MSNKTRALVVAFVVLFMAIGAWQIFFRPDPYSPPEAPDARAAASPAAAQAPGEGIEALLRAADGGLVMDKKRRDEILAVLRAMYADASAATPAPRANGRARENDAAPALPEVPYLEDNDAAAQIQSRMRSDFFPLARECYATALAKNPTLGGRLVLQYRIVGDKKVGGVVESVDFDRDAGTIADPHFLDCMSESMLSVVFDPPKNGYVTVEYPLEFSPGDPDE